MKIIQVNYNCEICGTSCKTTNHNLKYRKHFKNKHYCQKCIIRLTKCKAVFDSVPQQFHSQIMNNCISFDIALQYLKDVRTNVAVKFDCECGKSCKIRWNKLHDRKNDKLKPICCECLQRNINTTEDRIKEHSERSIQLWHDKDYRNKCTQSFAKHNRKMQTDVEYAHKNKRRCRSVSGRIMFNGSKIAFDSGYELIFLDFIYDKCDKIRRCEFSIPYGMRHYHPDFYILYPDGKSAIIEIKGYYRNNVKEKQAAARAYVEETGIADDYILYDTDKLLSDGILDKIGGAHMWKQIRRICNDRIVEFTEEKHRRIAEIGPSRYFKESKNQKNNKIAISR